MKKNILFIAFAFLIFSMIAVSAQTNSTQSYNVSSDFKGLTITSLEYSPYPANPGDYIDLWIQAENYGVTATNATFTLVPTYPFSLDPNQSATYSFSQLGSTPVLLHYKVRVNSTAVPGVNELKLEYTSNSLTNVYLVKTFNITVANAHTDFDLVLQDSTTSEVSIAIANIGENTANSMIVRIPDQAGFEVTGTSGQMVGNLDAGDYTLVSFEGTATGRAKDLEIEIDYTDSIGVRRTVYKNVTISSSSVNTTMIDASGTFGNRTGNFTGGQFPGNFQRRGNSTSWIVYVAIIAGGLLVIAVGSIFYRKNSKNIKEYFRKKKYEKDKKKREKNSEEIPDWVKKVKSSEKK